MAGAGQTAQLPALDEQPRSISVSQPASPRLTLTLVSAAFFGSIALMFGLLKSDAEHYPGTLTAETSRLTAPADGVVELVEVRSGQIVLPGRELFLVVDEGLDREIQTAERHIDLLKTNLSRATARADVELQKHGRETDHEIFETEIVLTELIHAQYQRRFEDTAWSRSPNFFDALASNSIPPVDLRSLAVPADVAAENSRLRAIIEKAGIENDKATLQTRIELCETRIKELRDGKQKLTETIRRANGVPRLEGELKDARAALDELQSREAALTVRSPIYGMAGVVTVAERDVVTQGSTLLEVFDRDAEFVTAQLPSRLAPQLRAGTRVVVHFPGNEDRDGEIEAIPPQVERSSTASAKTCDAQLCVRITAVGRAWPTLPIGSNVSVSLAD
ncbi:HlyD family efflux transporter periplasmic adaptor subunit [bacterium]|nr:HlyD family efflux transporter periplasmic adaptor subunit [bacterium]